MLENYPIRMHDEAVGTKSISPETSGSIHFLLARGLSPSPIDFDCPPISKLVLTRSLDRLLVQVDLPGVDHSLIICIGVQRDRF
jgi:hypothetical protein